MEIEAKKGMKYEERLQLRDERKEGRKEEQNEIQDKNDLSCVTILETVTSKI